MQQCDRHQPQTIIMNKQPKGLRLDLLAKIRSELTELIQSSDFKRSTDRLCVLARGFAKITKSYTHAEYTKHANNLADALLLTLEQCIGDKELEDEAKVV